VGCLLGRRVERETIIKWVNEAGYCKVAFLFEEKPYLLFRKQVWDKELMYGVPKKKYANINVEIARELWNTLSKLHNFKEMEIEYE